MSDYTCKTAECVNKAHRAGYCAKHYAAALASGECGRSKPCRWPDCDKIGVSRRYCQTHYARCKVLGEYGDPWVGWERRKKDLAEFNASRVCKWPECGDPKIHGLMMCKLHLSRARKLGNTENPWDFWNPGGDCAVCGRWTPGQKHGKRYCSQACNILDWKRRNPERVRALGRENIRRRRARIRNTTVDRFTDQDVRDASGDICYLCGVRINYALKYPHPKSPTLDHVVPLKHGGAHTLENCAMAHFLCNQKKHVSLVAQVPQLTLFKM